MPTLNPNLEQTYFEDKRYLENTDVPIVTISGTYREDLKKWHHLENNEIDQDVVFSRAHFSMALGVAIATWEKQFDRKQAWVVDPTNFVSQENWRSITFTEAVGKEIARHSWLKSLKNIFDKFGRKNLPILDSITQPLLYLTQEIDRPLLSFHIAAGNLLIEQGKTVLQVVTDPHVRYDYLKHAGNKRLFYAVFDNKTKTDLLEQAQLIEQPIANDHVFVTGPPIDPRVVTYGRKKQPWRSGPIKLTIATGGLGTNKPEILHLLEGLLPILKKRQAPIQLLVYAGTHLDIAQAVKQKAHTHGIGVATTKNQQAKLRIIYHPQIFNANELLIKFGFSWADGFITKPSGDMAYDAVASGSFLLTLNEWGEWEHNIREFFEQKGISRIARVDKILAQILLLSQTNGRKNASWIEKAMLNAKHLEANFYHGAENIIQAYHQVKKLTQTTTSTS
jgi:hypothetical protein